MRGLGNYLCVEVWGSWAGWEEANGSGGELVRWLESGETAGLAEEDCCC